MTDADIKLTEELAAVKREVITLRAQVEALIAQLKAQRPVIDARGTTLPRKN